MLKNLKIMTRLAVGFGLLMALIVVVAMLSAYAGSQSQTAVDIAQRTSENALRLKDTLLSVRQGRVQAWTVRSGDADQRRRHADQ